MIKISKLTKRFGTKLAVNDLNLEIKKGELFGFLGPNAAGKTTTIKILTGLLKPTNGEAFIKDYSVLTDYMKIKPFLSYIPDEPYLYDRLTGREFLRFVSDIYNLDWKASNLKMENLLDIFDIKDYGDVLVEEYSHGLRQKLVICAALLHDPQVIIVDEPMVGLDPKTSKLVKDIFKDIVKKGTTIFMSTHSLSVAEEICNRVGIIDNGGLVALGTVDELRKMSGVDGRLEDVFLKLT